MYEEKPKELKFVSNKGRDEFIKNVEKALDSGLTKEEYIELKRLLE